MFKIATANHPRLSSIVIRGFTLIELMIVIATIAIILTLALPVYSNYTIRAKIAEALSLGNAALTAVTVACLQDRTIPALSNSLAGYAFVESPGEDSFVRSIEAGGPCSDPVISITTKNTGALPDPVIILMGARRSDNGQIVWRCSSTTPNYMLPTMCRS